MFDRIAVSVTENMVKSGAVDFDEREIYHYGIQQGLFVMLNVGTTIAVGLLFGTLWQLLIFTISLIALKSYAGGYHAKTSLRCYFLSTLLTVSTSLLMRFVELHTFVYVGLIVSAGAVIIALSPVGSESKALDDVEKKIYRKRAVIVCIIEVLSAVVLLGLNLHSAAVSVVWCLVAVSVMIILGTFANGRNRRFE
jgi:accessory gene regulator B